MTGTAGLRRLGLFIAVIGLTTLAACSPWTVRPIQESAQNPDAHDQQSSPSAFVDSIWTTKILPTVKNSGVPARELLDAFSASVEGAEKKYGRKETSGSIWYFMVTGQGKVLSIDASSADKLLLLDVAPFDRVADVSIQLGPVLHGTALRDATGVVRFTDFANQLQFADVADELNDRVSKSVLMPLDLGSLKGQTMRFEGVFAEDGPGKPAIRDVVPTVLEVAKGQ